MRCARILAIVASATLVGVLAGCGGGGDGDGDRLFNGLTPPASAALEKYVGTWRNCAPVGADSELDTITITRTGETTANFSSTLTTHTGAGCTGTATASGAESGSITWSGTKTIGTETVDKIDILMGTKSEKQVAAVRADGTFHTGIPVGETGSNPDAQGYPGALDANGYTKVGTPTTPTTPGTPAAAGLGNYVGSWRACWPADGNSEAEVLTISKTSDTTGNFSTTLTLHTGAGCTGAAVGAESGSGSLTWKGTKTVGSETVDKLEIAMGTQTEKQIAVLRADGKFYSGIAVGDPGSNPDAEGYPGALETIGYTKLP
jgi:hypothetical protein